MKDFLSRLRIIRPYHPLEIDFYVSGCEGTNNVIRFLEHIQLFVTISYNRRGALKINITSPHGKIRIYYLLIIKSLFLCFF